MTSEPLTTQAAAIVAGIVSRRCRRYRRRLRKLLTSSSPSADATYVASSRKAKRRAA